MVIVLNKKMKIFIKHFRNTCLVSPSTLSWIFIYILPLGFGLFFLKTYKLISDRPLNIEIFNQVLLNFSINQYILSGILIIFLISEGIYILFYRNLKNRFKLTPINLLIIIPCLAGLSLIKLGNLCGLSGLKFIGGFKQEIIFILIYTYISVIFQEILKGRLRLSIKFILSLFSILLMLVLVIDFLFFTVSGTPGDWFLLKFSLLNFSEVWALSGEELNPVYLPLLIFPFILPIISFSSHRIPCVRSRLKTNKSINTGILHRVANWSALLFLLLGTVSLLTPGKNTPSNPIVKLGIGVFSDIFISSEDYFGIQDDDEGIYDSSQIELVKNDDTKLYNIVIILLESFHAKSTTPYNPKLKTTPFLNKLSENSIFINKMFSLNHYTTDTIITVHSGNYPPDRKFTYHPIFYKGLPDLLKPHGYITSYFTGQNLSYEHNRKLLNYLGFDEIYGQNNLPKEGYLKINWTGYEERITLKPSLEWIDKALEANKPFLITYLMTTSHQPYNLPESINKTQFAPKTNNLLNNYLNSLRYVDSFLADLFSEFGKRKLFESTVFVIVGDHGDNVGRGLRKLTEPTYHIPCLILGPSIKGLRRVRGMRQQIDILPSILDYLEFETTNGKIPGTSLFADVPSDRLIFFRNWNPNDPFLIRSGDYKFIFPKDDSPPKVHNIELDPNEKINISDQFSSEHLDTIKEKYLYWHKRVNYNHYRYLNGYKLNKK